jgi:hypothetical protein
MQRPQLAKQGHFLPHHGTSDFGGSVMLGKMRAS